MFRPPCGRSIPVPLDSTAHLRSKNTMRAEDAETQTVTSQCPVPDVPLWCRPTPSIPIADSQLTLLHTRAAKTSPSQPVHEAILSNQPPPTGERLFFNAAVPKSPALAILEARVNEVAHGRLEKTTWEQRASIWHMFEDFCQKANVPAELESVPLFLESRPYKGSTRMQYGTTLRTLLTQDLTLLDQYLQGVRKVMAKEHVKHAVPLAEEDMQQLIAETPDLRDKVVWRLSWITGSRWAEMTGLTTDNLLVQPNGDIVLDWGAVPKASKIDPYRSSRFVWITGSDARDLLMVKTQLGPEKQLTTLTTGQTSQRLKAFGKGYTAHSIKRGAVQHAVKVIHDHNLDSRTVVHFMKHADPLDYPPASLRYMEEKVVLTNDLHRLVKLM